MWWELSRGNTAAARGEQEEPTFSSFLLGSRLRGETYERRKLAARFLSKHFPGESGSKPPFHSLPFSFLPSGNTRVVECSFKNLAG